MPILKAKPGGGSWFADLMRDIKDQRTRRAHPRKSRQRSSATTASLRLPKSASIECGLRAKGGNRRIVGLARTSDDCRQILTRFRPRNAISPNCTRSAAAFDAPKG